MGATMFVRASVQRVLSAGFTARKFTSFSRNTCNSEHFIAEMRKVFHHPVSGAEVLQLTQGTRSVAEFAIDEWDQRALKAAFHRALSPELKDELAYRDPAPYLESLINVAIRLNNRIRDRQGEHRHETRLPEIVV
ncbi:hypothetical protein M9458_043464, partial [Cirrhinus mrigala]